MASQEWHWEQGTKYAVEGIKTTLLLNGAAAIALMTFCGGGQPWGLPDQVGRSGTPLF